MNEYLSLNNDKSPKTAYSKTYSSYENLEAAGLMLNEGVLIVDFDGDNKNEQSIINSLLEKYPTTVVHTTRGVHLYYSLPPDIEVKSRADEITVGGFQVDYKVGPDKYAVVKQNGKIRKGAESIDQTNLPPLPEVCRPLDGANNISGLKDGDGRNESLYNHLNRVRRIFPFIDRKDIAEFINSNCFGEPMDQREVEGVMKSVDKNSLKLDPSDLISLAKQTSKELNLNLYKGALYFKDGNKYLADETLLKRAVNKRTPLKRIHYTEVFHQFETYSELIQNEPNHINFRNVSLVNGEILPPIDSFTPFYIDVEYNKDAYDPHVDEFLNEITLNRKELRLTLEEILGHCLMIKGFPHKAFFLFGNGRNGKSTFLEMINGFVGDLKSAVALADFNDQTFLVNMIGKLVNCSDDTNMSLIKYSQNFKSISAGNTVEIRSIFSRPVLFKNTATIIVNANDLPAFKDKSKGLLERLFVVPFDMQLSDKDIDPLLLDSLTTPQAKSYILNLAISGMKTLIRNGSMTPNKYTEQALKSYKRETDHVGLFFENNPVKAGQWLSDIHRSYTAFCIMEDITPETTHTLGRRISKMGYATNVKRRSEKGIEDNRDRIVVEAK